VGGAGWARGNSEAEWARDIRTGKRLGKANALEKAIGMRGGAVDAPAVVTCMRQWEKEISLCFFIFWRNRVVVKVEGRRPAGPDR
jgi:hypothetical protein